MFEDLKKELSSFKLLTLLLSLAVGIYLLQFVVSFLNTFSDVILIFVFGWLLSFILDPVVDIFSERLKLPRVLSTVIVFVLLAVLITAGTFLFIPDVNQQLSTIQKMLPSVLKNSPISISKAVDIFVSSFNNYLDYIPSVAQFLINLLTTLILSFYLIVERDNLSRRMFTMTPKKWHENIKFIQKTINKTFASFVRLQIVWGIVGGVLTWVVMTIFGIHFAASTGLIAGLLSAIPVIGVVIAVVPPIFVTLIDSPDKVLLIFLVLFLTQQLIYNIFGPKIMGSAYQLNPIVVMFAILIGLKVAGLTGALFAIPVVSIAQIVGREFYTYYFKES